MSQNYIATPFAGALALLMVSACQEDAHPPFASDGDGGAGGGAAIPGVGVPNVSPGHVNPSPTSTPDTEDNVGGPIDQTTTGGSTLTTGPGAAPSATFTLDGSDATSGGAVAAPSEQFTSVDLTAVTVDTSPSAATLEDVTTAPSAGVTGATDSNSAFNGDTNGSSGLDGGAPDAGASSEPAP